MDGAGNELADEDGDPEDGHVQVTLSEDGAYFAEVTSSYWVNQGRRYYLGSSQTWDDARAFAQELGGDLVTINDVEEQAFVGQTFSGFQVWLGLNDTETEGTHVWSSGEPVTYTNWAANEPNTPSWNGAYMATDGLWYDNPVTSSWATLAEVPDPQGRLSVGPGSLGQYILEINVADLVPPQVVATDRIPEEGGFTDEVIASFEVTVSEGLAPSTVNNPAYDFATHNGHTYVLYAPRPRMVGCRRLCTVTRWAAGDY